MTELSASDAKNFEKQVITGQYEKIWFSRNKPMSPDDLISKINFLKSKATQNGWFNLRVRPVIREGDENNLGEEFLALIGDHLETDEEYNKRIKNLRFNWKRSYEDFKVREKFYNSTIGKAQIAEFENET